MMARNETPQKDHALSGALRGAALRTYLGRRKLATVVMAALALFVGYHVVCGRNGLTVYWQKRHEEQQLSVRLRGLQAENAQLKAHVDHLQSDPDAIEHEAREELHYTRPGEVIYTLPETSAPGPASNDK